MSDRRRTPPEGWPTISRTITGELLDRMERNFTEHQREDREAFRALGVEVANIKLETKAQTIQLDAIQKSLDAMEARSLAERTKRPSERPPTFAENELAKDAVIRRRIILAIGMAVAGSLGYLLHHIQ